MKIATFNVNGIGTRLPHLLDWLAKESPDVACLQELKAVDTKFLRAALRAAGYGAVWQGQRSWNGVAILAKGAPPVETRRGLPGDPDDTHSRYIEASVNGTLGARAPAVHAAARAVSRPEDPRRTVGDGAPGGTTRDPLLAAGAYLVARGLEETRNQVAILAELDAPATRSEAADETAVPEPQAAPA